MDEIFAHALKLLQRRDYTIQQMRQKLADRFGSVPETVIELLLRKRYLDDRRFAENVVSKRADRHSSRVRKQLAEAGVSAEIVDQSIAQVNWPSLQTVLNAKMNVLSLRPPLNRRDAARLFRVLSRLGYEEEEIREELEQLHEQ